MDVGISAFYIRAEDSPGLEGALRAVADERPDVQVYVEHAPPVDRASEDNYHDLMARQRDFINRMLVRARRDGVAWLFHTDDDEALYPRSKPTWPEVLRRVPRKCASVHVQNWEGFSPAQPKSSWLTDDGVRYLPQTCARHFAAYANGKSASRTLPRQRAHGPHHFTGGRECELAEKDGVVLHHDGLSMGPGDVPPEAWVRKNRLRIGDDMSRIPFEATHRAVRAVASNRQPEMRAAWLRDRCVSGPRFAACGAPQRVQLVSYNYNNHPGSHNA